MARIIADLSESWICNAKLSDNSVNDYFGIVMAALCSTSEGSDYERPARYRPRVSRNRKKIILHVEDETDLPSPARIVAIHDLTGGKLTVDKWDGMIGVTDAKLAADSVIAKPAEAGGGFKKWNQLYDGVTYTANRFDTGGTFRTWFSTAAIDPQGIDTPLLKSIAAATGVAVRTNQSYQSILSVIPIGP